jgi:hypothetical protein
VRGQSPALEQPPPAHATATATAAPDKVAGVVQSVLDMNVDVYKVRRFGVPGWAGG